MKIQIKEYFDSIKEANAQLVLEAKKKKDQIEKSFEVKRLEIDKLESEKSKKEKILKDVSDEDVDASKIKDKIKDLAVQIAKGVGELESLKQQHQELQTKPKDFSREDLLVSLLENVYKCPEAESFENYNELVASLLTDFSVKVTEQDSAGRPLQCELSLFDHRRLTIKIKPSERHFLAGFRPKAMEWLPQEKPTEASSERTQNNQSQFRAFILNDSNKLLLTSVDMSRTTYEEAYEPTKYHYESPKKIQVQKRLSESFADLAVSWPDLLEETLKSSGEYLDLEHEHKKNPLLQYIQRQIVGLTKTEPSFKECKEQLTSQEIYQRIKADWDAFSGCAWSEKISDTLALLKFHVENGERARFWSTEFDGLFGFRLRTRDHYWITGKIYISPVEKPATQKSVIEFDKKTVGYSSSSVPKLGRLYLNCRTSSE